jgi:dTDP-4-amino-4,6-dideoxygalactose transaminase
VIVDVDPETLMLDVEACEASLTSRVTALLPVHLYGQAADMDGLRQLAERRHLLLIEDCCQAHLATYRNQPVGSFGVGGAFSFYPTKNLGALGDGGAVITNDAQLARRIRMLRNGGQSDRYHHDIAGVNSRLDEIQAAVLRVRLPRLRAWTDRRRELAARYRRRLTGSVRPVAEREGGHVYHLLPVRVPGGSSSRTSLQAHLTAHAIETLIHYPVALNRQPAFSAYRAADCPIAAAATEQLLSLPLHPRLDPAQVDDVAAAVLAWSA